jgi:lipoprotein NlpD
LYSIGYVKARGLDMRLLGILFLVLFSGCVVTSGVYHTVEKGQTLWRICWTYGVDMQKVTRLNRINDPARIEVGQRIFIPGAKRARKVLPYAPPYIKKTGPPQTTEKVVFKKGRFSWPVKGKVVSGFGMRKGTMHDGIDISAPRGTPVKAADDGEVVFSKGGMRGYGNVIIIKHSGNIYTVYAHNKANFVGVGEKVAKGKTIASVGKTGNATGYNLHFELRNGAKPKNPLFFLP